MPMANQPHEEAKPQGVEHGFTGVCVKGPYDGETWSYWRSEISLYTPMLTWPFYDATIVMPVEIGRYIFIDGVWMWGQR